jgi:hypothetical protein
MLNALRSADLNGAVRDAAGDLDAARDVDAGQSDVVAAEDNVVPDEPGWFVIERAQRFSRSLLWQMQRRFFAERGLDAWSRNTVPHYITNNPALADALATVALGHLRDQARARPAATARAYIVELGAGSGRFAHYFLERLLPRLDASGLAAPVTYVLTDTIPALLEHWRAHPRLRKYVARGALDFALFDATRPAPLVLVEAGVTLGPGTAAAPLVVVANYVFDSIPCDCFRVTAGALAAEFATLSLPCEETDVTAPHLLDALALELSEQPIGEAYYGDPALDAILARYRARLGDTAFLFPIAALHCLAYLRTIGGGLLALVADRGIADERGLNGRAEPALDHHGSFSLLVNFHALAEYTRDSGGRVYQTSHRTPRLEVMALALGLPELALETACAFHDAVERGGPSDEFLVMKAVERHYDECTLAELLANLRFVHADPHIFWRCYPALVAAAGEAAEDERAEIGIVLARIWDTYFPIGEPDDLALALATVHFAMDEYEDARWYVGQSFRLCGPSSVSRLQLAKCHHRLGDRAQAALELDNILRHDPGFGPARELRAVLDAEAVRFAARPQP